MRLPSCAAVFAATLLLSNNSSSAGKTEADLSDTERRGMKRWLAEFKRARKSRSRRDMAAKRLAIIGEPAIRKLQKLVDAELNPALEHYETAVRKRVATLDAIRLSKGQLAEIQRLRSQVLALKSRRLLTKDMITREADPALAKLRQLISVDPKVALARLPRKLAQQRKDLLTLGRYWEYCTNILMTDAAGGRAKRYRSLVSFKQFLEGRERMAVRRVPLDARSKAVFSANAALYGRIDPEEASCIRACNAIRSLLGLPVLAIDLKLVAAARDHSSDMRRLRFFSHTSPVPGKRSFSDRARRYQTSASGENIFYGIRTGLKANEGWFHSPGHHRNMLGGHTRVGVGRSGTYFTQMFGR